MKLLDIVSKCIHRPTERPLNLLLPSVCLSVCKLETTRELMKYDTGSFNKICHCNLLLVNFELIEWNFISLHEDLCPSQLESRA